MRLRRWNGAALSVVIGLTATALLAEPFYFGRITKLQEGLFWIETPGSAQGRGSSFKAPPSVDTIKGRKGDYRIRFEAAQAQPAEIADWANEICGKLSERVATAAMTRSTARWTTIRVECG